MVTLSKVNQEKDLVILIKHREPHSPTALVEGGVQSDSAPAIMVTFYPQFPAVEAAGEFLFLVIELKVPAHYEVLQSPKP